MIFFLFCAYFCSLIFAAHGVTTNCGCTKDIPKPPVCDCTNPVYIDQPTNIAQCLSKAKFYAQVNANFDIVYGFIDKESARQCNYTTYRNVVNEMKKSVLNLVDSYFKCTKRDCMPDIENAYEKYRAVILNKFAPFIRCSYINLSPECAVNIKHATYFSAENIYSTLIECARFKASCQRPDIRVLVSELLAKKNDDCNCIKIDQRPIPVSEEQCYSPEYYDVVKKFISDNFSRVKETYRRASIANPQCDYSPFIDQVLHTESVTSHWPDILKQSRPRFEQFEAFFKELVKIATETNTSVREYILKEDKTCYFTPRQLRQSILTISNYVIQILTKCVNYRDAKNSTC